MLIVAGAEIKVSVGLMAGKPSFYVFQTVRFGPTRVNNVDIVSVFLNPGKTGVEDTASKEYGLCDGEHVTVGA